jgi:hypothetical protein
MMRSYSILLLTAVLVFAACDSGDADEPLVDGPGRFSASVTIDGGGAFSFDGLASATSGPTFFVDSLLIGEDSLFTGDSLRSIFMITLGGPVRSGPSHFISLMRESGRPEPGAYDFGGFERTGFGGFFSSYDGAPAPTNGSVYVAESGTLTVEFSNEERIAGRFEFRARSFDFGEGGEAMRAATVRGAFDAQIRSFPTEFPRGLRGD